MWITLLYIWFYSLPEILVDNCKENYLHTPHQHQQSEDSYVIKLDYYGTPVVHYHLNNNQHHPGRWAQYQHQRKHYCMQLHLYKNAEFNINTNKLNLSFLHLLPVYEYPSCLQITVASVASQLSSHTVPHWSLMQTSTLPSY